MLYYGFSRLTSEYIGSRTPQIDPLESAAAGKPVYCLPGQFETTVEPPTTTPGAAAVWSGTAWSITPDHRGETWWQGATPVVIEGLGDPAALGLKPTEPPADPPATVIPFEISPMQARIALHRAGLLPSIEALMSDPSTDAEAKLSWEYAVTIRRQSPFIDALAPSLGITSKQIDDLFLMASQIT